MTTSETQTITPMRILVVEDNPDDVFLLMRVLEEGQMINEIDVVTDGVEALAHLESKRGTPDLPGLVLLDVNMPRMNGFEVLHEIKHDRDFKTLPVVILTSSTNETDVAKSYASGACSYITKPVNYSEFRKLMSAFNMYWTVVAKLP